MKKILFDILILSTIAFGILWLLDSTADAQCANGQCPAPSLNPGWRAPQMTIRWGNPAIVRIKVKDKSGGGDSLGSGTIFRRERKVAYVLTAAHVIKDRVQNGVVVWVRKQPYQATVLVSDKLWDVAILRIADPGITPITMADKNPSPGDSLECSGLGQNGSYAYQVGRLTQFVSPGKGHPAEWLEVQAAARQGDSGGPIANVNGRLVGLITGTNGRITVGPCLPRIRAIIKGVLRPVLTPICPPPRPMLPPGQVSPGPSQPTPLPAVIDYDKLAAAVLKQINPDDFRGLRGPAGPKGAHGEPGAGGSPGASGSYNDLSEEEMLDLAEKIKKLINGSVRIKVQAVP